VPGLASAQCGMPSEGTNRTPLGRHDGLAQLIVLLSYKVVTYIKSISILNEIKPQGSYSHETHLIH